MRCFVPGCNLKYTYSDKCWPERESFFRVPKDMLSAWQLVIPKRPDRALTYNDYVCSRHFPSDAFYPTAKFFAEYDGINAKGILNVPKKVNILPGAVPTIFPGSPEWLAHQQGKKRSATPVTFSNCKRPNTGEHSHRELARTAFQDASSNKVLTVSRWEDLMAHSEKIILPNSRWAKVVFNEAACKTLSFMETVIDKDTSLVSVSRQLTISRSASTYFGDRFRCKTFVWKTEVPVPKILGEETLTRPNLYDIQAALWLFANQTVCKGGSKVIKGCNFKTPYIYIDDNNSFRHIDCTLFCTGESEVTTKQCSPCQSIDELLRQNGCFDSLKFLASMEFKLNGQMHSSPVKIKVEQETDDEASCGSMLVHSDKQSMEEKDEYDAIRKRFCSESSAVMGGIGTYYNKLFKVEPEDTSPALGEPFGNFFIKIEKD